LEQANFMARAKREDGFQLVMVGASVQDFGVQVGSGVVDEASEEIFGQLGFAGRPPDVL
jgi:hypothetical protein